METFDLITTDELLQELEKRFDVAVFHGTRYNFKPGQHRHVVRYKGQKEHVVYYLGLMQTQIQLKHMSAEFKVEDNDS